MNKKRLLLPANAARAQIAALKLSMASLSGSPGLNAQIPDDDPDLIETWKHSLNECFELDCQHVQKILDEAQFAGSIIELSITQTDSLLRVCSAIRLKINERYLTESPEIFEGTDDFGNQGLRLFDEGGETVPTAGAEPLLEECREFLSAIEKRQPLPQGRDEIVVTTAVCETVERSLKTGQQETVPPSTNGRTKP